MTLHLQAPTVNPTLSPPGSRGLPPLTGLCAPDRGTRGLPSPCKRVRGAHAASAEVSSLTCPSRGQRFGVLDPNWRIGSGNRISVLLSLGLSLGASGGGCRTERSWQDRRPRQLLSAQHPHAHAFRFEPTPSAPPGNTPGSARGGPPYGLPTRSHCRRHSRS